MVEIAGVFAILIFVAAVAGLFGINEIDRVSSYESTINSEITETSQTSQDEIIMALNDMNAELVKFFSDLKEDLGFLSKILLFV